MRRALFLVMAAIAALAPSSEVLAQRSGPPPKVGLLSAGAPAADPALRAAALREGLRELGWIEGRTVTLDYRYADGDPVRLPALAAELVAAEVALIVTFDTDATSAARQASRSIPIVMATSADPIGQGFVSGLARPGGNVTGVSLMMRDLAPKQLEVLKESVSRLARVGVLHARTPFHDDILADLEPAARSLRIEVHAVPIAVAEDLPARFAAMVAAGVDAILVLPHPALDDLRGRIGELALLHQLPSVGPLRSSVASGFLLSYGPSLPTMHRLAARYVDRILKGASPAELAVEQPRQFELVVNLGTAWALGLSLPASLLARADEVIE